MPPGGTRSVIFARLRPLLDWSLPPASALRHDLDLVRRARLLTGGSQLLALVALVFVPPTVILEGPTSINVVALLGGAGCCISAPLVLRWTGSITAAASVLMAALFGVLGSGPFTSGGFDASTLRFSAVVPLLGAFLVNARYGLAMGALMGLFIEGVYLADVSGYPFAEPPLASGERWFSAQVAVLELVVVGAIAWVFDAGRAEVDRALRAGRARVRRIAANTPGVIFRIEAHTDGTGRIAFLGAATERLLGLTPQAILDAPEQLWERFHEDDRDELRTAFKTAIGLGSAVDWIGRVRGRDGELQVRITARLHVEDGVFVFDGYAQDLTEQVDLQQQLHATVARLRAVVANMGDGLVAVDRNLRIQAINPAFGRLMALDERESAAGTGALVVLTTDLRALIRDSQARNEMVRGELSLPGGRIGAAVVSPLVVEDQVTGAVVLLRDITLEKDVDRMKTEFIATVSHELRTPMTSVLGFAKVTRRKLEQSVFPHAPLDQPRVASAVSRARDNMDIIVAEGERLTRLINDVLDIARMEAGRMDWEMGPVDPAQLVRRSADATAGLFTDGRVELRTELGDDLPPLHGDEAHLQRVLINLVSNAAKHTHEGVVVISARRLGSGVRFEVRDTGEGIDPEHQATIFEKFRQVQGSQGTGLGLPICREIVAAHGGSIELESVPGEGSTFSFVLTAR